MKQCRFFQAFEMEIDLMHYLFHAEIPWQLTEYQHTKT